MDRHRFLRKILIIDDEAGMRDLIKEALEADFQIFLAENGQSGLEQARTLKPDLVLLDIRMPDMDGMTVLRKLKTDHATQAIPVVMVSVHGETDILLESQRAGAADHVIKPFKLEELRKVVHRQFPLGD